MVTQAVFDRAMTEIYAKIKELRIETANNFTKERDQLELRLKAEAELAQVQAEKDKSDLLQGIFHQLKAAQDINMAQNRDLQAQLSDLLNRLDQSGHLSSDISSGTKSVPPQPVSTLRAPVLSHKLNTSEVDSEFLRRDNRVILPRSDCPSFNGGNPIEWLRKCTSFFEIHQIPPPYRTHLATMQFKELTSEWYDGFLIDHEPPDWEGLVQLVNVRFKRITAKNTMEELKALNQTGTVEEYWIQFERVRSRILLDGRRFSERDFIDTFVSGLKGEIKPFVQVFKPSTLEEALEYALQMEMTSDNQYKRIKNNTKPMSTYKPSLNPKNISTTKTLPLPNFNRNTLIEQRRALGQYFKCGEKYFPGHQCKLKAHMLLGQEEEERELIQQEEEDAPVLTHQDHTEEAIVSMHATSSNPLANTMRFKGQIGQQSVFSLIDSGSTHSFVNPNVVHDQNDRVITTNPMIVMVANGSRMLIDSTCQGLQFSIQGHNFCHDLRLLQVQGYDMILGLYWLATLGPMQIDWQNKWIEFQQKGKIVKLQVTPEHAVLKVCESVNVAKELKAESKLLVAHIWLCESLYMGQQTTKVVKVPQEILEVLDQYTPVFETQTKLPPKRPIDHAIPLIPNARAVNLRPYRYSHFQKLELDKIILKNFYPVKSFNPQPAPMPHLHC
jgi:Retroviral aspartyl protease/Ty3 transposon capsid-like protein